MIKKRNFSVHDDLRTGLVSKIFLLLGLFLLLTYIFLKISLAITSLLIGEEIGGFSYVEAVIAFSIIFFGFGAFLHFLHLQFAKLAKIADDFEEELQDIESKEEVVE